MDLNPCQCCEGIEAATPAEIFNPPGLAALKVRAGTQASFKEAMLVGVTGQSALARLTTRDDDDPTIGIVDAWASALDVLTFYNERIANEAYLRSATERRSVLELAREIGYELGPGVAAGTHLAFTLETLAGAPDVVPIPVGVRAQSIPGPDEKPQLRRGRSGMHCARSSANRCRRISVRRRPGSRAWRPASGTVMRCCSSAMNATTSQAARTGISGAFSQ